MARFWLDVHGTEVIRNRDYDKEKTEDGGSGIAPGGITVTSDKVEGFQASGRRLESVDERVSRRSNRENATIQRERIHVKPPL